MFSWIHRPSSSDQMGKDASVAVLGGRGQAQRDLMALQHRPQRRPAFVGHGPCGKIAPALRKLGRLDPHEADIHHAALEADGVAVMDRADDPASALGQSLRTQHRRRRQRRQRRGGQGGGRHEPAAGEKRRHGRTLKQNGPVKQKRPRGCEAVFFEI
jgi:hypothetical protein